MKQNLTLILMNEAVREGWREWMEKVRRVLPQTDAERPVTWIAAERLARENGRMVRLVELLFRFRRERASEYRKGIPPMFGKADLQEVEKYLPHLRGCSFREEIALALPKVKNVEELARECAMSVNTLGRRFKEELNTTPHRWLTEQRKAHVTSLLADTDMPLQEIADVCGFATPSYLWDFCKKHLKATPAEIREIARCARTV